MSWVASPSPQPQPAATQSFTFEKLVRIRPWAAVLMRYLPLLLPLALLPLFVGAILLNTSGLDLETALALVAPVLFYCGYAIYAVKRTEAAMKRWQARFEYDVHTRIDEFNPQDARSSRNYFEMRLGQEIRRSKRHGLALCVVTLTLPRQTNGEGIFTSDLVKIAASTLRTEDSFGRLGRDKYAISLPHTTPRGAAAVIERLKSQMREQEPQFGIAYLPPGRDAAPERLIELALGTPADPQELAA